MQKLKRVIFYIDGFNLYYGLKESRLRRYYWLNIETLAHTIAKKFMDFNYKIRLIRYFTSKVKKSLNINKYNRQKSYLGAIKTLPLTKITYGRYKLKDYECRFCGKKDKKPIEKMTDVNIASFMFWDAYKEYCDIQILIGGDTDLKPITERLKKIQKTELYIFFPLHRETDDLKKYCKFSGKIYKNIFKTCQFSNPVINRKGNKIFKPIYWN